MGSGMDMWLKTSKTWIPGILLEEIRASFLGITIQTIKIRLKPLMAILATTDLPVTRGKQSQKSETFLRTSVLPDRSRPKNLKRNLWKFPVTWPNILFFLFKFIWHLKMEGLDTTIKSIQLNQIFVCLLPCDVKNPGQMFIILKWPYLKYRPWGMLTLRDSGGWREWDSREAVICRAVKMMIGEAVQFYSLRKSIWSTEDYQAGFKYEP